MREVIKMVGISRATIYRWMDAGDLPLVYCSVWHPSPGLKISSGVDGYE